MPLYVLIVLVPIVAKVLLSTQYILPNGCTTLRTNRTGTCDNCTPSYTKHITWWLYKSTYVLVHVVAIVLSIQYILPPGCTTLQTDSTGTCSSYSTPPLCTVVVLLNQFELELRIILPRVNIHLRDCRSSFKWTAI